MIPRTSTIVQTKDWQNSLATAIRSVGELLAYVDLPTNSGELDGSDFPLRVPHSFADKMVKGDPQDPLLLQVLPTQQELDCLPGYTNDPLAEHNATPAPGIIHKYHGRVLLVITSACAVHCRYCFRRHFPYQDHKMGPDERAQTLSYIACDSTINEVIFSGGDPLAVNDKLLIQWADSISDIHHVKRLRFHTRLPAVIPERITDDLIDWISNSKLQIIFVVHINHPNEIDTATQQAIHRLVCAGATVFNQTVLLKNINDNIEVLTSLSEKLFESGVIPYYLHILDKVAGGAHFDIDSNEAKTLYGQLSSKLPGYLLPKLVREDSGGLAKTILKPLF